MLKLLPTYLDNPLFYVEIRHVRWGQSPRQLRRYAGLVLVMVTLLVIGLMLYYLSGVFLNAPDPTVDLFVPIIIVGVACSLFVDFACLLFTFVSHPAYHRTRLWEMLRLTPSGARVMIEARYAVAHIRAWQVALLLIAFRLAIAITVLLFLIRGISGGGFSSLMMSVPSYVVFAAVYVVEPLWRIRAVTAIGLRESLMGGNPVAMLVRGGGAVLSMTLLQAVVALNFIVVGRLITLLFGGLGIPFVGTIAMIVVIAVCLYVFYDNMGMRSLRRQLK